MTAPYQLLMDWDDDGTFGNASADVTPFALSWQAQWGASLFLNSPALGILNGSGQVTLLDRRFVVPGTLTEDQLSEPHNLVIRAGQQPTLRRCRAVPVPGLLTSDVEPRTWLLEPLQLQRWQELAEFTSDEADDTVAKLVARIAFAAVLQVFATTDHPISAPISWNGTWAGLLAALARFIGGYVFETSGGTLQLLERTQLATQQPVVAATEDLLMGRSRTGYGALNRLVRTRWFVSRNSPSTYVLPDRAALEARYGVHDIEVPSVWVADRVRARQALVNWSEPKQLFETQLSDDEIAWDAAQTVNGIESWGTGSRLEVADLPNVGGVLSGSGTILRVGLEGGYDREPLRTVAAIGSFAVTAPTPPMRTPDEDSTDIGSALVDNKVPWGSWRIEGITFVPAQTSGTTRRISYFPIFLDGVLSGVIIQNFSPGEGRFTSEWGWVATMVYPEPNRMSRPGRFFNQDRFTMRLQLFDANGNRFINRFDDNASIYVNNEHSVPNISIFPFVWDGTTYSLANYDHSFWNTTAEATHRFYAGENNEFRNASWGTTGTSTSGLPLPPGPWSAQLDIVSSEPDSRLPWTRQAASVESPPPAMQTMPPASARTTTNPGGFTSRMGRTQDRSALNNGVVIHTPAAGFTSGVGNPHQVLAYQLSQNTRHSGYHFLIGSDGTNIVTLNPMNPNTVRAFHASGMIGNVPGNNWIGLSLMYDGLWADLSTTTRDNLFAAAATALASWKPSAGWARPATVMGHADFQSNRSDPGADFPWTVFLTALNA